MKNDARLDLRLPTELLERVQEAAGQRKVNAWVRSAIEAKFRGEGLVQYHETPVKPIDKSVLRAAEKRILEEIPIPKIAPRRWG